MKKIKTNRLWKPLLWISGIAAVFGLVIVIGADSILSAISMLDIRTLLWLIVLQTLTLSLSGFMMWVVLHGAGMKLSFFKTLSVYMASQFIENVTPSIKFGGEAAKIYLLKRETGLQTSLLAGRLFTLKIISLLPFAVIFLVSSLTLYLQTGIDILPLAIAFFVLSVAVGIWLLWSRADNKTVKKTKVGQMIQDTLMHMKTTVSMQSFIPLTALSTFIWILYPVKFAIVAHSLGVDVPFTTLAVSLYIGYMVSMLPLLPGGLGSFESSVVLLLGFAAVLPQTALAMILVLRLATYWMPLLPAGSFAAVEFSKTKRHKTNG